MLRPYQPYDESALLAWVKDERTFALWSAGRYGSHPLTAEALRAYFDSAKADPSFRALTLCDEAGGPLGHLQLRFLEEGMVRFSSIIVDASKRGQGLGRRLLEAAEAIAFSTLGAKAVTISVFTENAPAIALYTKLGYRWIGEDAPAVVDGKMYPRIVMGKTQ